MVRKAKSESKKTGLYRAREARGMSRSELMRRDAPGVRPINRHGNDFARDFSATV